MKNEGRVCYGGKKSETATPDVVNCGKKITYFITNINIKKLYWIDAINYPLMALISNLMASFLYKSY